VEFKIYRWVDSKTSSTVRDSSPSYQNHDEHRLETSLKPINYNEQEKLEVQVHLLKVIGDVGVPESIKDDGQATVQSE
jgi:hypothetical protein